MKKTLTIILVIALLCVLSVGTTLTYFTDTDFDKNVMTVGEVDIIQTINGEETGIAETTKLYPAVIVGNTINNAVGMEVKVTLASNSEDAYVRTVYAFEMMKVGTAWVNPLAVVEDEVTEIHYVTASGVTIAFPGVVIYKDSTGYTTDATNATAAYVIGVATASNKLTGTATFASLTQVYLDSDVGNEFSTAVGGSYEILALSQAVQAQGFDSAAEAFAAAFPYGENNANVAGWFTPGT